MRLTPGQWYVNNPTISITSLWLQGSGPATVLNVVSGGTGLTVQAPSVPGLIRVSNMMISGGAQGLVINGAGESYFWDLYFTGQTTGSIYVDGDYATETHFTDIAVRQAGGIGFDYERTTATGTGGIYMDRVRVITPLTSCNYGFKFNSTTANTAAFLVMTQCVADNIYGTAMYANNMYSVLASTCWFTVPSNASSVTALHVTAGYDHTYSGCYLYNGNTSGDIYTTIIDGGAHEIQIGANTTFDGGSTNTALSIASAGANILLADYWNYTGALAYTPANLGTYFSVPLGSNYPVTTGGGVALQLTTPTGLYMVTATLTIEATGAGSCDADLQMDNSGTFTNIASTTISGTAATTTYQSVTITGIANVPNSSTIVYVQLEASVGSVFTVLASSVVYSAAGASQMTFVRF